MDTQDWLMIFFAIALCGISFILMHNDMKKNVEEYKIDKFIICYSVVATIIVVVVACNLQFKFEQNSLIFNLKRVCMLAVLWPVALIDFKSYRIPNEFILFGLFGRALILPFELMFEQGDVMATIIADIIAAVALFAAAALCKLCIKNSIGAGDVKLFLVMGLLLGLDGIWSSIFMSLIVSFFIAVYLLLTKKKNRKDSIPFGPAIAVGTFISVFLGGM